MSLINELRKDKLIAILRKVPKEKADSTMRALKQGGVKWFEVTMESQGAATIIEKWQTDKDNIHVGAGTVLNLDTAKDAISAGAEFIISPNLDQEVVSYCIDKGIEVWPGVMTPSEIVTAIKMGVSAVKLFPAGFLGVQYIKNIKGPLANLPIIVTGGINLQNVKEFINSGIFGVGLGSSLVNNEWIKNNRFDELTKLATKYKSIIDIQETVRK
ncbi:bifunctional 4-hydroxy-2-oxoglutarate aldolase/2-dehydro-3-deoxy-phosphogluconate aldolase [Sporolactobacillus sp. THM7-4]|nr:bifunctional 4-hydroxy-2-oxoglutarate aldolase/2-dehydro-3-deoxy-phosphogluconate aldolase [Sporolactobacillus sp. THM7-4]